MMWLPTAGEPGASHGCPSGWRIRIPTLEHPVHGCVTHVTLWTCTKYPGPETLRNRPDPSTCRTIPDPGSFNHRRISSTGYLPSPGGVFRAPGPPGPDPHCSDPVMSLPDPRRRRAWWSWRVDRRRVMPALWPCTTLIPPVIMIQLHPVIQSRKICKKKSSIEVIRINTS